MINNSMEDNGWVQLYGDENQGIGRSGSQGACAIGRVK